MYKYSVLVFLTVLNFTSLSQNLIQNGSFEGQLPFYSRIPTFWTICDEVSSPDIQPISSDLPAFAGNTYLGLVARVHTEGKPEWNGTVEAISQDLQDTLIAGQEYHLRLYLMYDPNHKPSIPLIVGTAGLRAYVGSTVCGDFRLVWESPVIDHQFWKRYDAVFTAGCDENIIRIEAAIGDQKYDLNYIMVDSFSLSKLHPGNQPLINCDELDPNRDQDSTGQDSDRSCGWYIPNAFSPNNDGKNDIFKIFPNCQILNFQMKIFDRWGNLVFHSKNENNGWDGKVNQQEIIDGVYLVQIISEYLDKEGKKKRFSKGEVVNLFR